MTGPLPGTVIVPNGNDRQVAAGFVKMHKEGARWIKGGRRGPQPQLHIDAAGAPWLQVGRKLRRIRCSDRELHDPPVRLIRRVRPRCRLRVRTMRRRRAAAARAARAGPPGEPDPVLKLRGPGIVWETTRRPNSHSICSTPTYSRIGRCAQRQGAP